ncbi:MAG: DUF962 domain-containing protein [Bacteroidetes bacterium]|nr:DUF962 domain-containing protein [Bacteroidota bacterium]
MSAEPEQIFKSLKEFYPFYLTEHNDSTSRILHFTGTLFVFILLVAGIVLQQWWLLAFIPVAGYGFAWTGHAFFEKNKPATFQYPFYSLASDFIMFWELLTGKIKFRN